MSDGIPAPFVRSRGFYVPVIGIDVPFVLSDLHFLVI